jgi:hypothetical protein
MVVLPLWGGTKSACMRLDAERGWGDIVEEVAVENDDDGSRVGCKIGDEELASFAGDTTAEEALKLEDETPMSGAKGAKDERDPYQSPPMSLNKDIYPHLNLNPTYSNQSCS